MTDTRDDFVISFKPHPGHDAPLFVIKGGSAPDVADKIAAAVAQGLFASMASANDMFRAAFLLGTELGAVPAVHPSTVAASTPYTPPRAAPAAPAGPPGLTPTTCLHGTKTYKTGNGAKGPWQAWMCPAPKGTVGQCPPEWIN